MKRTSLRMSSSRFKESTISEIAKTDEGIVVLKKNGDIAMLPKIYDYTDEDRSLIYCVATALFDLDVVTTEDINTLHDSERPSKSVGILRSVFQLPDLVEVREPWWGHSMYFCDPIFTKTRDIIERPLRKVDINYYDSIDNDFTANDLYEEVCENTGIHIISIYSKDLKPCSVLCVDKLIKSNHIILYCWNPLEPTSDGLAYNCVLNVRNEETSIITYKSQCGGYQYDDVRLDTSLLLIK